MWSDFLNGQAVLNWVFEERNVIFYPSPVPFSLLGVFPLNSLCRSPSVWLYMGHTLGSSADSSTVTSNKVIPQHWNMVCTMQQFCFNNHSQSIKKGHSIVETFILYWSIIYCSYGSRLFEWKLLWLLLTWAGWRKPRRSPHSRRLQSCFPATQLLTLATEQRIPAPFQTSVWQSGTASTGPCAPSPQTSCQWALSALCKTARGISDCGHSDVATCADTSITLKFIVVCVTC